MASLAIGIGLTVAGAALSAKGQQEETESQVQGIETQAQIEALGREASQEEFEAQIERQAPFLQAGEQALSPLIQAISNRGTDVSNLPGVAFQQEQILNFLGDQAPDFISDKAITNLEAIEFEQNKGRLSDLVNIGLGSLGTSAGARVNLGTTVGQSLGAESGLKGLALQTAATGRQNRINTLATGLSGIPALIAAQSNQPTFQQASPLITQRNPLGLAPGQGL
jgi:hypothetical protein